MQITNHLLMIAPVNFGFNTSTAGNNSFQKDPGGNLQQKALAEFQAFVALLHKNKIDITVLKDSPEPHTPDSLFPNNWISFHDDGAVFLYPMFALNRRMERKDNVLAAIREKFDIAVIHNLSSYENENLFLEGTGSMVLDRVNHIAYACLSPRTSARVLEDFCRMTNYEHMIFTAKDRNGTDIYHTNVMMCLADAYAVVCIDSLPVDGERDKLIASLNKTNKEIITISFDQLEHFAGNMLQVISNNNEKLLIMSAQAYHSLTGEQLTRLEKYNRIIHTSLDTIETAGGGSARCMLAEVFLPLKNNPL